MSVVYAACFPDMDTESKLGRVKWLVYNAMKGCRGQDRQDYIYRAQSTNVHTPPTERHMPGEALLHESLHK